MSNPDAAVPTVDINKVVEKLRTRCGDQSVEIAMLQVHVEDLMEEIQVLRAQVGRRADTDEARKALQRREIEGEQPDKEHTS